MALLKKGSKGKPVEELQGLVNKLGIKPELKVDGIFGPLTEKGVRDAQKKLKLNSVDGKAGDYTVAALKYGKPLPYLEDYVDSKTVEVYKTLSQRNAKLYSLYEKLAEILDEMVKPLAEQMPKLRTVRDANKKEWEANISDIIRLLGVQTEFEKKRLADPKGAEKLVKDGERLHDQVWARDDAIFKRIDTVRPQLQSARAKVEVNTKVLTKILDEFETVWSESEKKINKLNR